MPNLAMALLYVDKAAVSAAFYADLLGLETVHSSPNFSTVTFPSGFVLALWSKHTARPAPSAANGSGELLVMVDSPAAVDTTCESWRLKGLTILQEPEEMVFGRTCVALDPDGHRIRLCLPDE
ncbi:MAG: VOC family protein [Phyllobacterium sp.]